MLPERDVPVESDHGQYNSIHCHRYSAAGRRRLLWPRPLVLNALPPNATSTTKPCLLVDAVAVGPVSTTKFPGNREKNRDFCQIPLFNENFDADSRVNSRVCGQIPCATKQGIFWN